MKTAKPVGRQPASGRHATRAKPRKKPRVSQAVVIIHGMGEQRPMDTLRGFVREVWSTDLDLTVPASGKRTTDPETGQPLNRSWIVPDQRTGSHELRRITTPGMRGTERRTDFYELYWADLMRETPIRRLVGWLRGLLLRRWSNVPRDAVGLYVIAWAALLVGLLPAVALWVLDVFGYSFLLPKWIWTVFAALVSAAVAKLLLPYLGDVADYVRAIPDTVGRRADVRKRGLDLLKDLMDEPGYDRIVLVGHSLGSVIAYDLLQILWADYGPSHRNPRNGKPITDALEAIGAYALPLGKNGKPGKPVQDTTVFRQLQWNLYKLLRKIDDPAEKPWKISDFVTVGSPLTHAEFLIARTDAALKRAIEERLFSTCPPISDKENEPTIVYYEHHAHHASVFAATRWTNIYDRGNGWFTGDPFSGPLAENFGAGVLDRQVRLTSKLLGIRSRLFTHTDYWTDHNVRRNRAPDHIRVLREAVDLERGFDQATKAKGEPSAGEQGQLSG